MVTRPLLIAVLVILFSAAGCASNEKIQTARHSLGPSCCKSFQELPFKDIAEAKPLRVEVDVDAPVFEFPEGKSRFAAFRVPRSGQSGRLRVKTTIVGIYMPDAFVFFPAVTFLDSEFRKLQFLEPPLKFERQFLGATENQGWVAEVPVPATAAYVIFHTPTAKIGTRLYYKEGVTTVPGSVVPAGNIMLYMPGNWWDVYLPAAGAGRFELELKTAQ